MAKPLNFEERYEFRISTELKDRLIKFCGQEGVGTSEVGRDALENYMDLKPLIDRLITYAQNNAEYETIMSHYGFLPGYIKDIFEVLMGSQEVSLVDRTPVQLIPYVKVLTAKGSKAIEKRARIV